MGVRIGFVFFRSHCFLNSALFKSRCNCLALRKIFTLGLKTNAVIIVRINPFEAIGVQVLIPSLIL